MDKSSERRILLKRFFWKDRALYRIGKVAGLDWFNKFDRKFARDKYAYFSLDEKREAIEKIVSIRSDETFIKAVNEVLKFESPKYLTIDRFVGKYYYFDKDSMLFKIENRQDIVRKEVREALKETGEAGYFFLKAIIELWKEGRWDDAYGGATWVDILAKIRELGGRYPSPRHVVIIKSYRIYYKTGSRRYPTHTIPEEMIPIIEEELERFKSGD